MGADCEPPSSDPNRSRSRTTQVWLTDAEQFGNGYAAYSRAYSLTNPHYTVYMEAQFSYKEQLAL